MSRALLLLLFPCLAAAGPEQPKDEVDATSLLSGAREVNETGQPEAETVRLFDGVVELNSQWEPRKESPTAVAIIQLAEPFDLHRLQVVNSLNEESYPGISTRKLRLEHAGALKGPWKPVAELTLKKGSAPQQHAFKPIASVRYLRLTLVENYGNKDWWSLAELSVFGRRSKPRAKVAFSGTWDTNYGPMRLEQKGALVSGCYGDEGTWLVEGTADGPIFFGTYTEEFGTGGEANRGAMAFALTAEGELAGVWGDDITGKDRTRRWDGTRSSTPLTCKAKKKSLSAELKQTGRVVLRGILFDTGKDVIKPESVPVLESLAAAIKEGGEGAYVIEGHTDDRGGEAFNKGLSDRRAGSVKKWLVEHGVEARRLTTVGYGQSKPAMSNESEAGRAANRRVEVASTQKQ